MKTAHARLISVFVTLAMLLATAPSLESLNPPSSDNATQASVAKTQLSPSVTPFYDRGSAKLNSNPATFIEDIVPLTSSHVNASTPVAGSENVELLGHIGGASRAVFVQANYAYVGMGTELAVLDISNPAQLVRVGYIVFPAMVKDVYVVGNYAYVVSGNFYYTEGNGLRVVNVSNPAAPVQVGFYPMQGEPQSVTVVGNYAYLAAAAQGLQVIDISNPTTPTQVGSYNVGGAWHVAIAGSYAYVADCSFGLLRVVDISNPAAPTEIGSYATAPRCVVDVSVAGNYAYIITNWYSWALQVLDISNPAAPIEVGSYIVQSDASYGLAVAGNYVYVCSNSGLQVVDVSNPITPTQVGSFKTQGMARDVAIVGNYAYVADDNDGLHAVDISHPNAPTEVDLYHASGSAYGFTMAGDYAYVVGGSISGSLSVIDVSNPVSPVEVGYHVMPYSAYGVAVAGHYAYATSGGLRVIDITNPATPTEVGFNSTNGDVGAVAGDYAYLAAGTQGLRMVNISNPTAPIEVGSYTMNVHSLVSVAVANNFAYTVDSGDYHGMQIVDVSNPISPTWVGTFWNRDIPRIGGRVAVAGSYAYTAYGGLYIVDVSDPAHPSLAGGGHTPEDSHDVSVVGDYAYTAGPSYGAERGGMCILDVSNPVTPTQVGFYNILTAWAVAVSGDHIYVVASDAGLYILRHKPTYSVSGRITDVYGKPITNTVVWAIAGAEATTDDSGYYTVTGLLTGTYTLHPVKSSYIFTPTTRTISVPPSGAGQDFIGASTEPIHIFTGTLPPVYPLIHTVPITVMQGGTAYRYLRVTDSGGNPIPNAVVTFSSSDTATSDASGYLTATISADTLGGPGSYSVGVQTLIYGGQVYSTTGQPAFPIHVTAREYSHAWSYGTSMKSKGGVSAGYVAYLKGENSGGMELTLDETDPNIESDDIVSMKEQFSDEIGAGGGVETPGVKSKGILRAGGKASLTAEAAVRTFGSSTARFPSPYTTDERQAQGIYLVFSFLDSLLETLPNTPFFVGFAKMGIDRTNSYSDYISEQQAGVGTRIKPMDAQVGVGASLNIKDKNDNGWKGRWLNFDVIDLGTEVLSLGTFTDYRDKGEWGLAADTELDLDLSALSLQLVDFRNKLGYVSNKAKKYKVEYIFDSNTNQLKRLEHTLTGEGDPASFTDVVKEEVSVKTSISASELTPEVLAQTVNFFRLWQAARQTGSKPLQISSSALMNELNLLFAPVHYVEYEVSVKDGTEIKYETEFDFSLGLKVELGPGLKLKQVRDLVRERGVFLNGRAYRLESYASDGYVSRPGKDWTDLTGNALGGLWESVKDVFDWVAQKVESGIDWGINTVSRTAKGIVRGGARLLGLSETRLYTASPSLQTTAIQQTSAITITAIAWVPTDTVSISQLGLNPALETASGQGFVVGGIYAYQPYTLTFSPAATLVITYTDEAAAGVDESHIRMFRWNPEGNNWQPMAAVSDTAHNAYTASVDQLGTFALGNDATPPEITVLDPTDGSTISNTYPVINAWVVDKGVGIEPTTVKLQMDGQAVTLTYYITGTGELAYLPGAPLAIGVHTVTVSAADVMGNVNIVTATFTVDWSERVYLPLVLKNYTPPPTNGPDLIVSNLSVNPAAPTAGQQATVYVTVKNQGNQPASNWFFVHLYVDHAPTGRADVSQNWAYGPSSLAPGATFQASIPITFTAGSHNLYAQADTYWGYGSPDYGNVQETREDNNVLGPMPLNVNGVQ